MSKPRKRLDPEFPKSVFLRLARFRFDPARAAAEDELDRRQEEEMAEGVDRAATEWTGDPGDWVGWLQIAARAMPVKPPGFCDRRQRCNRCGALTELSLDHDALFCEHCNRWIEPKCEDAGCKFCSKRPERPLP